MRRLQLVAVLMFGLGAFAEARACTIFESFYKPGSPEAIAEDRADKMQQAKWIAGSELVFVGKVVSERLPTLGEIAAAARGQFGRDKYGFEVPGVRSWFEPVRTLKGTPSLPTTNIFSGDFGSTCRYGPSLKVGSEVIVYAFRKNDYLFGETASMDVLPYVEAELVRQKQ